MPHCTQATHRCRRCRCKSLRVRPVLQPSHMQSLSPCWCSWESPVVLWREAKSEGGACSNIWPLQLPSCTCRTFPMAFHMGERARYSMLPLARPTGTQRRQDPALQQDLQARSSAPCCVLSCSSSLKLGVERGPLPSTHPVCMRPPFYWYGFSLPCFFYLRRGFIDLPERSEYLV